MKRKDKENLRSNSIEELKKKVEDATRELVRIAQERYTKQSKNVREKKMVRLKIAQIKTLIREKELSV